MTDATDLDEAAIRARLEAATRGPWEVGDGWVYTPPLYEDDNRLSDVLGMKFADLDRQQQERARAQANAEFIAHARTDVERLLAALDEARAEAIDSAHALDAAESALAAGRALADIEEARGCYYRHQQGETDECNACTAARVTEPLRKAAALTTPTTPEETQP